MYSPRDRYPGVRCDIPSHVYQSSFSPNTQWSEEYATGPEIRKYWQDFARKHDLYSKMRLSTKVTGSYWEPQRAQWRLETEAKSLRSSEHFDFVIQAIGRFNDFRLPDYPGMDTFKGTICHSSAWDESFDAIGKRIATIGNGASGIQVTPALQKVAKHIDHYARSPTWIGGAFTPDLKERQDGPMYISKETKEALKDEETYLRYRKKMEDGFYRTFEGIIADSQASKALPEKFTNLMKDRLERVGRVDLLPRLTPDFPPHCRRLTPGPGYLEVRPFSKIASTSKAVCGTLRPPWFEYSFETPLTLLLFACVVTDKGERNTDPDTDREILRRRYRHHRRCAKAGRRSHLLDWS
jgi:cation diffusion facilitator CzcD-associated flavoprotein CzcO